jgi:autotransporter-associated beta strand protein
MKTSIVSIAFKFGRAEKFGALTFIALAVLPAFIAKGDIEWQGGTASYTNAADWVGGIVPGATNNADNSNGTNNVVQINVGNPDWTLTDISAGEQPNASGAIEQNGQTLNVNGWLHIGNGSNSFGIFTLNGGTINVPNGPIFLGEGPSSTSVLNIKGGVINMPGSGNPFYIGVGNWNGNYTRTATVNQSAGTVNMNNQIWIGQWGNGTMTGYGIYNLSGGAINMTNYFAIGRSGGNGTLNMTGGVINQENNGNFLVGTGYGTPSGGSSVGVLNQSGGTINCLGQFLVPEESPATGTYSLSGTGVLVVNNWIAIGRNAGNGVLNMDGGSITKGGDNTTHLDIGASATGILNQTNGVLTNVVSDTYLGESGTGTWNLYGGSAILGNLIMCVNDDATGTLNLNGGLLQVTGINSSSIGVSIINFDGGTLRAGADNDSFISGIAAALLGPGGVVIDSQGYNITIPQELDDNGGGGLTKIGTGTLALTGPNTYTGATTVSNGTLDVETTSSANGNYMVADGAALGVTVESANAQLNMANLTAGSSTGAALDFDLGTFGNPASAPLNVNDTFTAAGTIVINVADAVAKVGQFPLIKYGSLSGSATFTLGTLPSGMVATLVNDTANNSIDLDITAANEPRWQGLAGGNWDIGQTTNWINLSTGLPTTYDDGNPVVFNDSALGTTTVNVTTTVSPGSITMTNSSLNYTFVGTGSIGGSAGLNKQGSASLSILNTGGNSYTGPTTISGGTLTVTNLANGGSPSPIGASTASPNNLVIGNGTFAYAGAPAASDRGFTVASTNSTVDAEGNLTLGGSVAATSGSGFVKTGPAQLTLTTVGNNEFSGGQNPGLQVVQGTMVLDGSAGAQTNSTPNDMYVGDTLTSGASLLLTNTSLNVGGWFAIGRINGGINNVSSATLDNSTMTVGNLSIGWDGGQPGNLSRQFLTLSNSTLTDLGNVNLCEGDGSTAMTSINGDSVFHVQNPVYIGLATSSTSTVVVANSGQIIQTSGWFDVGQGSYSVGTLIAEDNAKVSLDGDLNLGDTGTGTTSSLTALGSAQITANNFWLAKGLSNNATVNISGSATMTFNSYIDIGDASKSSATVNLGSVSQPGGSLTSLGDLTVGDSGTGVLNMVTNGGGTLTVHGTIYLSRGSSNAFGSVDLNAGSTIVAGYINNGYGFTYGLSNNPNAFNFNGGTLEAYVGSPYFIQPYVRAVVQSGGAIINDGGYTIDVLAGLLDGGGGGGLTKLGSGTLRLDGNNTYTGSTLVGAGTLAGSGSIASPVTVASGAALGAGSGSIGTLTINNSLAFSAGSMAFMRITPTNNDEVAGLTGVSYNGTLVVTNMSGTNLVAGSTFKLFNCATAGTGNFTSVTILPSGSGTFNPANGVLTITATTSIINPPVVSNGNLILTGNGGAPAGSSYSVLTTTNLALPLADWTTNATGTLDNSGMFSNSIPINVTDKARFFRVKAP